MEHETNDLDPETVTLPIVDVLRALAVSPGPLQPFQVDMLVRHARDPDPDTWALATQVLGLRAGTEPTVRLAVEELLLAPVAELRLRGVNTLGALAETHPDEVMTFIRDGLASETLDGVQAEALLSLLARLALEDALPILEGSLLDGRDMVRAAAVSSLAAWPVWPQLALDPLASDPSPLVRANLALALSRADRVDEAADAWRTLAASEEGYVRAFVADALRAAPSGPSAGMLEALAADADLLVRDVAAGRPPAPAAAMAEPSAFSLLQDLERQLDEAPAEAVERLRQVMERPDAVETLGLLSHLARRRTIGELCGALAVIVEPTPERPAERLARVMAALDARVADEATAGFGRFVLAGLRALEAHSAEQIVVWVDLEGATPLLGLTETAAVAMTLFAQVGTNLRRGLLSDALFALEEGSHQVRSEFRLPERLIALTVIDRWTELIETEIEQTVAGVSS